MYFRERNKMMNLGRGRGGGERLIGKAKDMMRAAKL